MSSIFGGSKPPPGPTQEELDAQAQREERVTTKENAEVRKLSARSRSRRTGGQRLLMSQDRTNPALGNEMEKTTLGPGRNPRA
tara:strand:- start:3100 stop:3348 length:249 start_codon:yes stop_codon:yes gene_type:complete